MYGHVNWPPKTIGKLFEKAKEKKGNTSDIYRRLKFLVIISIQGQDIFSNVWNLNGNQSPWRQDSLNSYSRNITPSEHYSKVNTFKKWIHNCCPRSKFWRWLICGNFKSCVIITGKWEVFLHDYFSFFHQSRKINIWLNLNDS